jgi:hypothetical protein
MSIAELRNTNGSVGQTTSKEARGGYSSSVEAALGHFGADAVTAVELAAQILRDHTHYARTMVAKSHAGLMRSLQPIQVRREGPPETGSHRLPLSSNLRQ